MAVAVETVLVGTFGAVHASVVPQCGSTVLNAFVQYVDNRDSKCFGLGLGDASGIWVNVSSPQSLICVDVADPGYNSLR